MPISTGIGISPTRFVRRGGSAAPTARNVAWHSNSFYTSTVNLGVAAQRRLDVGWGRNSCTSHDLSSGGNTWSSMVAQIPTLDAWWNATAGADNVVFASEWINEFVLAGRNWSQASGYAQEYRTTLKALHDWYIIQTSMTGTAYDEADAGTFGDPAYLLFREWENPDPTFTNKSRWRVDHELRTNLAAYGDRLLDFEADPYYAARLVTHGCNDAYPQYYQGVTVAGRSHPNQWGVMLRFDAAIAYLVSRWQLASYGTLYDGLWEVWPLWDDGASNGGTPNLNYWCNSVNPVFQSSSTTQNPLSVTLGALFGGYLSTSAAGANVAHQLHATTAFCFDGFVDVTGRAWVGGGPQERPILCIPGEFQLYLDTSSNKWRWKVWTDSGGSTTDSVVSALTPADGLHHFHCGYDGTNIFLSVNGETLVAKAVSAVYGGTSNEFYFCANSSAWQGLGGNYSWWKRYNRVLTSGERATLRNGLAVPTSLFANAA